MTPCAAGPVIPAMANLHSHAFQRAMAGLAEVAGDPQDSFWTWRDLMYRMVQRLSPEQVGAIATHLYIDMLKGGYSRWRNFTICITIRTASPTLMMRCCTS